MISFKNINHILYDIHEIYVYYGDYKSYENDDYLLIHRRIGTIKKKDCDKTNNYYYVGNNLNFFLSVEDLNLIIDKINELNS